MPNGRPYITDWSRDLFDGGGAPASAFAVERGGALEVLAFDGMSADAANAARIDVSDMMWLPVAGLDRHTPIIGLWPNAAAATLPDVTGTGTAQRAIYRPICDFQTARG